MDMLRIEDLSLSYGDKPVVQNLNLRVKKGQVVSIIGPNASGKSTILKTRFRQNLYRRKRHLKNGL